MPHKTRIILFYTFVALFLATGTAVLFYSFGWRIDFETGKAQKIGAIYIKANVRDVTIKINNKEYKDEAGILQSGTLISNLLPKTYRVEITKQGYWPYRKALTVQPSRVEELLNVQLIPEMFESTFIAPAKGTKFIDMTPSADKIILQDASTGIYYLYDKTNASSTVNLTMAIANAKRGQKIKRIAFVPFKPTQFVIDDATGLKLFDSEKKTIETLLKGSIATWTMQGSTIVAMETARSRTQELFTFNLIFKTKTPFDELNGQLAKSASVTHVDTTNDLGTIAFTNTEKDLFLFAPKDRAMRRIAKGVRSFAFSPDDKKLMFLSDVGDLSILFVDDFNGDIRKKAGEVIPIDLPKKETIDSVQWYADSYHLLIAHSSELFMTELDDRKPLNIFPLLSEFSDQRYVPESKSVYFTNTKGINAIRIER